MGSNNFTLGIINAVKQEKFTTKSEQFMNNNANALYTISNGITINKQFIAC